jgi:hypothetical protein
LVVSPPVDCDPLNDFLPDQPPDVEDVEHDVAFWLDHDNVEPVPTSTLLGLAVSVTTGANSETVTVTDCVAEPPDPVQVSSYSVVLVSAPVDQVPLVAIVPRQPPEAVQAVALAEFQLKVDMAPLAMVVGDADNVTVGAGEVTTTSALRLAKVTVPVAMLLVKAALLVEGFVTAVWPDDDCPHAAKAENTAHPSAQRTRREAVAESNAR